MNMEIISKSVTIREFVEGYNNQDKEENGITTMNGKLNLHPSVMRGYIRQNDIKWKENLIESIIMGCPIGLMSWGDNGDGTYENVDGQQRGITICDFVHNKFNIVIDGTDTPFERLSEDMQNQILNYKLYTNIFMSYANYTTLKELRKCIEIMFRQG